MRNDANGWRASAGDAPSAAAAGATSEPDWAAFNLIGRSPAFLQALQLVRQWARVDATVLVCGETGTGKELAARAIHYLSARRGGPFIPVNCGAITDSLLEAELFGHVRGAFTDAKRDGRGLIALARGGTLFLDEIDSLSARAQAALLRFAQDHCYRPVGGDRLQTGDLRVIAATNADLAALCREGRFREDLLFRLNLLTVTLPALRDRQGDALLLAQAFVRRLCAQYGVERRLDETSIAALQCRQAWPGNVRELENRIHRCFLTCTGEGIELGLDTAGSEPKQPLRHPFPRAAFAQAKAQVIAEFERDYVQDMLREAEGNLSLAARLAGKERSRFGKLVKKHGLERGTGERPQR